MSLSFLQNKRYTLKKEKSPCNPRDRDLLRKAGGLKLILLKKVILKKFVKYLKTIFLQNAYKWRCVFRTQSNLCDGALVRI